MSAPQSSPRTYVVERYLPALDPAALDELTRRLERCADEMRRAGLLVFWLGSTGLIEDETSLCTFLATSRDIVVALNRRARAPYERIVEAVTRSPAHRGRM